MKLPELFQHIVPVPDFKSYLSPNRPCAMPPLDTRALVLQTLSGEARRSLRTPVTGDSSLVLRYKGDEGGVVSLAELEDGETWSVEQVQGGKSRKSYRVATGLKWPDLMGHQLDQIASHPEAQVRRIVMPHVHGIKGVLDGKEDALERMMERYKAFAAAARFRYSEALGCYVGEVTRD